MNMKNKIKLALLLSAAFVWFASPASASIVYDYASPLNMTGSVVDNNNGTWTYNFSAVNTDSNNIWFVNFYTGQDAAQALSSNVFNNVYTQYTDGGGWNVPAQPDQWFAGLYNDSWPQQANWLIGQSASFSLTLNSLINNIQYAYWTQNNWSNEHFQALGTVNGLSSVPVPAAVWLFGSGLVGLMGFNRKRAQSAA